MVRRTDKLRNSVAVCLLLMALISMAGCVSSMHQHEACAVSVVFRDAETRRIIDNCTVQQTYEKSDSSTAGWGEGPRYKYTAKWTKTAEMDSGDEIRQGQVSVLKIPLIGVSVVWDSRYAYSVEKGNYERLTFGCADVAESARLAVPLVLNLKPLYPSSAAHKSHREP